MPDNRETRRSKVIDRILDILFCCFRGNKKQSEINEDDLVVTRVYKSSSVLELRGNQEILPGFPYIPAKQSRSDVFILDEAKSRVIVDEKQANEKKYGTRRRDADTVHVVTDSGARNDVGGDTGDVVFEGSDGLEIINIL
jgi:hypothetical protein